MDISKIKEFYKQVKQYSILDENDELLIAIAEYIIKSHHLNVQYPKPPENYVTLKECEKIIKYISANTLGKYCCKNEYFKKECAHFDGYQWFVDPIKAEALLKERKVFKKRLERLKDS